MMQIVNGDTKIFELFEFKPRKGDLKKIAIIEAAIDCMATIGHEKTTYEAIAKKIGTRRAHVAYHFKDKGDILEACVRYIISGYQQSSMDDLKNSKEAQEPLMSYIDTPFDWAKKHPKQLSVMFLFYYHCSFNQKHRDLHDQIRQGGAERVHYILSTQYSLAIDSNKCFILAKQILNLISGSIMNAATTNRKDLEVVKNETRQSIRELLNLIKQH